jgi:hypothetical protein
VLYVATAEAGDQEMAQRTAQHRHSRPESWLTLEVTARCGGGRPGGMLDLPGLQATGGGSRTFRARDPSPSDG